MSALRPGGVMDAMVVDWTEVDNPGLALERGSGPGNRLLAPGVPDDLIAAGGLLCWSSGDLVSVADPDSGQVRAVALCGVEGLAAAAGGFWVLTELGVAAVHHERGQYGLLGTDMIEDLDRVEIGGCLLLTAGETRACFTLSGRPLPLPDGVQDAAVVTPLADAPGLAWADEARLYSSGTDGRTRALTRLPAHASQLIAGPRGVLVASLPDGTCCAVTGDHIVELAEDLLLETARFSDDGRKVLAAAGCGVVLVDLRTGEVEQVWAGVPVGFLRGEPLVLDEDRAALLSASGHPIWTGFHAAGPAWDVPVLIGPAGAAWDLSRGRRTWPEAHLSGGVSAFDGERVLHVSEREATLLDEDGAVLSRWRVPLFPEDREAQLLSAVRSGGGSDLDEVDEVVELAWLGDQVLALTADGELGLLDPEDGTLLHRESLGEYAETDGWAGLTPLPRSRVLVRIGDGARILPGGPEILPPSGNDAEVQALVVSGQRLFRAWGSRVECAPLDGEGGGWSSTLQARLLALGRWLMAAEGDDLVLLDAATGNAIGRVDGVLEGCNVMAVLSDGHLWAWGGYLGMPRVICCDGRTGALLREWELPAAGVVSCGGASWAWTEEGALYRLELG